MVVSEKDKKDIETREFSLLSQVWNPVHAARILIHLGHEPLAPVQSHTPLSFVGLTKPIWVYPWLGSYIGWLRRDVGWWNVFTTGALARGFIDLLMGASTAALTEYLTKDIEEKEGENDTSLESLMEETNTGDFVGKLIQMVIFKTYEVTLTQPFFVIMVRQVAAFIGHETQYKWFPWAVTAIYRENGMKGYFQGYVPRLLGELGFCALYYVVLRLFRHGVVGVEDKPSYMPLWRLCVRGCVAQITHPFTVVSTVMAVRGCGLGAAYLAPYPSWRTCWSTFSLDNQLKRGSVFFWRNHVQGYHFQAIA